MREQATHDRDHVDERVGRDERGQDLLEYALLASLIAIVALAGVQQVGSTVKSVFWDAIAAASF